MENEKQNGGNPLGDCVVATETQYKKTSQEDGATLQELLDYDELLEQH